MHTFVICIPVFFSLKATGYLQPIAASGHAVDFYDTASTGVPKLFRHVVVSVCSVSVSSELVKLIVKMFSFCGL